MLRLSSRSLPLLLLSAVLLLALSGGGRMAGAGGNAVDAGPVLMEAWGDPLSGPVLPHPPQLHRTHECYPLVNDYAHYLHQTELVWWQRVVGEFYRDTIARLGGCCRNTGRLALSLLYEDGDEQRIAAGFLLRDKGIDLHTLQGDHRCLPSLREYRAKWDYRYYHGQARTYWMRRFAAVVPALQDCCRRGELLPEHILQNPVHREVLQQAVCQAHPDPEPTAFSFSLEQHCGIQQLLGRIEEQRTRQVRADYEGLIAAERQAWQARHQALQEQQAAVERELQAARRAFMSWKATELEVAVAEQLAAEWVKANMKKPVAGFIAGPARSSAERWSPSCSGRWGIGAGAASSTGWSVSGSTFPCSW